ncbi:Kinesin-like protein KIN-14Q [Vitis vinifera]|uniref:Kinesin-like protein n=1 Tax=Vitis vinifera TaxID=29760 RepID=A0A438IMI5_VITVI|nr:Kinesin-like protein KIN-14Q [Vitis vinifera]
MATAEDGVLDFSVASVVEDVLQQQGNRLSDVDLASRKAEEASLRRYEAAGWLRRMVGVVGGRDLAAEPSEEEFRLGLRSGIILCNALNKVQPGAVSKVVEGTYDSVVTPDGAALSAFQYFENVRNFLVALEEMGLPSFEASDLEQGGKSARIVNCVLALKSYYNWKQGGGNGSWKYGGTCKPPISGKQFARRNSEPFVNSFSRSSSISDRSLDGFSNEQFLNSDLGNDPSEMNTSRPFNTLVRAALSDKKQEEIPNIVESLLSKVMEEFEIRLTSQNELMKPTPKDAAVSGLNNSLHELLQVNTILFQDLLLVKTMLSRNLPQVTLRYNLGIPPMMEEKASTQIIKEECYNQDDTHDEESERPFLKQQLLFEQQRRDLQELKHTLHSTKAGNHLHGLVHAASGYRRVLEENRKLYNQLQDLKGSIRVYCRVRPFLDGQPKCLSSVDQIEEGSISIITPSKYGEEGRKSFNFNKVFGPSATQEEVFSDTQPLIRTVEIRNSSQNGINVPDANLVPVSSTSDVIYLMNLGQKNRVVSATALNDRSSRSHSCVTVHVQGRDLTSGAVIRGSLHLVDLAGSERVDKSEVTGAGLKEAQHINRSLSALGDVIASLAQKNSHVPYRNSKLTQLLQDSLGGQAKTLMFVHISPEPEALGETISTLKFAERVSTVELGAARVNKESSDVKELREQIANLKAALARKEGESEHQMYSRSSSPERLKMKSRGSSPSLPSLRSVADISGSRRQPMEDVGNIQVRNNSALKPRRQSFDLHDLAKASAAWKTGSSPAMSSQKEDEGEIGSGDWVDKAMLNKQYNVSRDRNSPGSWEEDNRQLPEMFFQTHLPNPAKIYPEQPFNKFSTNQKDGRDYDGQRNRFEVATDDSDELEAATSDCSEQDLLWQQLNLPRVSNIPNGLGSKNKRTNSKLVKSPEKRSLIPSLGTSASRKLPIGISPPLHRRQAVAVDGKQRTGNAK